MEFIRKILNIGKKPREENTARGVAPLQTQEEQDVTRKRMEDEMSTQRERRESKDSQT